MTTKTKMTCWIDVMGAEPCYVAAYHDAVHERVLVDAETLGSMIDALRRARLFDDETTEATVEALQQTTRLHGLVDVTEAGGGWENWQQMVVGA